jgi:hypothetical protein
LIARCAATVLTVAVAFVCPERIVRHRDLSPEGLKEKVRFTVGAMEERLGAFGLGWKDTTAVQAYTVHDFYPVMADELVRRARSFEETQANQHETSRAAIDPQGIELDGRCVLRHS